MTIISTPSHVSQSSDIQVCSLDFSSATSQTLATFATESERCGRQGKSLPVESFLKQPRMEAKFPLLILNVSERRFPLATAQTLRTSDGYLQGMNHPSAGDLDKCS
jgi:hypothetical protein